MEIGGDGDLLTRQGKKRPASEGGDESKDEMKRIFYPFLFLGNGRRIVRIAGMVDANMDTNEKLASASNA